VAFDITAAIQEFEDIELEEFGESVVYVPHGGTEKTIDAIIERGVDGGRRPGLQSVRFNQKFTPAIDSLSILISQGATKGIASIQKGVDKIKMKREQDDEFQKYFTVTSAKQEYGCWRIGVL
jgi:hypothetical protein